MFLRQELALFLGLHALGNDFQAEGETQRDSRATKRGIVRIGGTVFDERPVDLHTIHVQQLQPGK